jgi:nucleoside-diphosphate-sugar epimerase
MSTSRVCGWSEEKRKPFWSAKLGKPSEVRNFGDNLLCRILLTSTSEVYGDPLVHPQTEEYWGNVNPIGVRSCYDEGKRVAETLMFDYHRQHGIEIRIARIFNTYGPRMNIDDGRVVSNFVAQALRCVCSVF